MQTFGGAANTSRSTAAAETGAGTAVSESRSSTVNTWRWTGLASLDDETVSAVRAAGDACRRCCVGVVCGCVMLMVVKGVPTSSGCKMLSSTSESSSSVRTFSLNADDDEALLAVEVGESGLGGAALRLFNVCFIDINKYIFAAVCGAAVRAVAVLGAGLGPAARNRANSASSSSASAARVCSPGTDAMVWPPRDVAAETKLLDFGIELKSATCRRWPRFRTPRPRLRLRQRLQVCSHVVIVAFRRGRPRP